jgi:acetyl esterase
MVAPARAVLSRRNGMKDTTGIDRLPRGVRLLHALQKEPDWPAMTATELASYRDRANRLASSRLSRLITGRPDRGALIGWEKVTVADRVVSVRVYRPTPAGPAESALPLVLQVHGGGFVGTAAQCDWMNSHLAVRLPAVVVSVEHRLLAWGSPMFAAVDDGWDVLCHVIEHADRWGIDPARVAVAGESCGALIAALADHGRRYAQRLRESGTPAEVAEHPGAPHAFVTLPGVAPQAAAARRQITDFLRARLAGSPASPVGPAPARVR